MTFTPKDYELDQEYRQRQTLAVERERLAQVARAGQSNISLEVAVQVCQEIRQERATQWFTQVSWQCRLCQVRGHNGIPVRLNGGVCNCPLVAARLQLRGAAS
jgi:post-segregation antitoxin (ccd killing protein)